MSRREEIAKWKKIKASASQLKAVAEGEMKLATRMESEAEAALAKLGVSQGGARKGVELSPDKQISLQARITPVKS